MKYRYVFLLGRAGCGKSALYRELERQLLQSGQAKTFERVDDFPKLWARFQRDDALEAEGKERIYTERTADGGYFLTNDTVLNEILQEVNSDVLKIDQADHMVYVEFARPNYVEAIQNFDDSVLEKSIAVYLEVSFEICWARNARRHEGVIAGDGDDHMVGRDAMEALFLHDDRDAFVQYMMDRGLPVRVVNNEADGEEHLVKQVGALLKDLF